MILPRLRADQARIAKHPAKIKVLTMGRRWGKTILGGTISGLTLAQHGKVAWIAPTYKNTRPMWRWLLQATAQDVKDGRMTVSRSDKTITTKNGGLLGIYSGDNIDSIRGEAFHVVVVDEASRITQEAYQDAIMPTLADYDGDTILISTPRGKNWFYHEWLRGQSGDPNEIMAWQAPTSDNPNPNIRKAFERVKSIVPESTYREEWLAQFIDGGSVFRRIQENATATLQDKAIEGHNYIFGCDWAQSADFTVISVIDTDTKELVYMDRFNEIDYSVQVGRLHALYNRFTPMSIIAEANSIGGPIIEQIRALGMPVHSFMTTNASKAGIIQALSLAFEQDAIKILNDKILINELQAYQMERLASGLMRYNAPSGMHDDTVMSLALAWHGASVPTGLDLIGFA